MVPKHVFHRITSLASYETQTSSGVHHLSSPKSCTGRHSPKLLCAIGAIGASMNRVHQPRPLVVLLLNVWMGTAAGADFFIVSLELSDPPVQTMKQKISNRYIPSLKTFTGRHSPELLCPEGVAHCACATLSGVCTAHTHRV